MAGFIEINVTADQLIRDLGELAGAIEVANRAAVARIKDGIRDIMLGAYNNAVEEAGDGFPDIYARHLRRGILSLEPEVFSTGEGLVARYFEIDSLGTTQDLAEGFHYHALTEITDKRQFSVSSPQRVELPYSGEPLYNDFSERYDFWQSLVNGEEVTVQFGKGKSSHTKTISTAGLYEETLRARVQWWGDRYPEWILLEYGVEHYPDIPPTHFSAIIEQRVFEFMTTVYEAVLESVAATWEQPNVRANSAGQLINEKGQFQKYLPNNLRR